MKEGIAMIKYFIQIDTSSYYQSDLIEISEECFDKEYLKCKKTLHKNIDFFIKEFVNEFDDRRETEYMFGFIHTCIFLIKKEYK